MAEGGSMEKRPAVETTRSDLLDSHRLECPICLEQLRLPKVLPCHHSFCQECLDSYIIKEVSEMKTSSSFSCPVCRGLTHLVDKSEDKKMWAAQFPTDHVTTEMIELKKGSDGPKYCMPCERKGTMTTPAQFWCKFNKILLCESCKINFHDVIHTDCDIVDVTGSKVFIPGQEGSSVRCEKHRETLDYFCEDHKILGCSKCIIDGHRKCEFLTTTEDYCEQLRSSLQLDNVRTSLQQGADVMETLIKDFCRQIETIAEDRDAALASLTELRDKIYKYVDKIQKEITDKLIATSKAEKNIFDIASEKCERLMVSMRNTLESSERAEQKEDKRETILMYQRGQLEVEACKGLVSEIGKSFSDIRIKHEIPEVDIASLKLKTSLGKMVVQRRSKAVPVDVNMFGKHLSECVAKEVEKIYIKSPSDASDCGVYGAVFLPGERIVLGDRNNQKIKLLATNGDIMDELKVQGKPWGLCLVDQNTVAATTDSPGGVRIIQVTSSNLSLLSHIKLEQVCRGITYTCGEYIVSAGSDVYRLRKDGTVDLLKGYTDQIFGLSHDKQGHIYVTIHTSATGKMAVSRLFTGQNTDVLRNGIVNCAVGVDVDNEGNVYVCGRGSHNVLQMSRDGTNIRELLTKANRITNPAAIAVCEDKFLVTNESSARNYIHVFQLI